MRVYELSYTSSSYDDTPKTIYVTASNATRAAEEGSKKKYLSYGGRVLSVAETLKSVVIAK